MDIVILHQVLAQLALLQLNAHQEIALQGFAHHALQELSVLQDIVHREYARLAH